MIRIIAWAVLILAVATFWIVESQDSADLPQSSQGEAQIGGDFNLTSHKGQAVTNETLMGKPRLVYFGFTYCPDICPMGLASMQAAVEILRSDAPEALFITIDPERDDQAHLAEYMENFPAIMGLTGSLEQIKQAAKVYRIYFNKVETEKGDYTMDHTSLIYLMDAEGKYVAHFPHTTPPKELAARIQIALENAL